ncbi:MAG: choice-of-anchor D domain-containing protein, partial [Verrucomicrobiota bacterium]
SGSVDVDAIRICLPFLDISVLGIDGSTIRDGELVTSTTNGTDFGTYLLGGSSPPHIFTITNQGNVLDLNIDNFRLQGPHSNDFTILLAPLVTNIAPLNSTIFALDFAPNALGPRTAEVYIAHNDADEQPYTFRLIGFGIDDPDVICDPMVVSDQQVNQGTYAMEATLIGVPGLPLDDDGFFPNFDLINTSGVNVLNDIPFTNISYLSNGVVQIASNQFQPPAMPSLIELGTNTVRFSALQSNGFTWLNYTSLTKFTVFDDDTTPPTWVPSVTVSPTSWTNVNNFSVTWNPASDGSGILEYRVATNVTPLTDLTAGVSLGGSTNANYTNAPIGVLTSYIF